MRDCSVPHSFCPVYWYGLVHCSGVDVMLIFRFGGKVPSAPGTPSREPDLPTCMLMAEAIELRRMYTRVLDGLSVLQ